MYVRRQAFCPKKDCDGDSVSCSTDTSRWSTPSRPYCGSDDPQDSSDDEDKADSLLPQENQPGPKESGFKKDKKGQGSNKQKTNHQILRLPPVKPLQGSKPRAQSATMNCIRQLRSQVWDLQQQLSEAKTENKLLKTVQHRHTVALQHFQDSESSVSQILAKHDNETRALKGLLRDTRMCRDNLSRQLQATEIKLLNTRATLQHLQLLSQDQSLLEREELALRLAKATAELEEKNRRMQDMERNLELSQASFKRQMVTEQRKVREARKTACYLQEHIYQLTRGIQSCNKQVQDSMDIENPERELSSPEEDHQEDTETSAGLSELFKENTNESSCSEESAEDTPEQQTEDSCAEDTEASEAPQVLEEEQEETDVADILEKSLNEPELKRKEDKLPKIRRKYTFKQSIENLHIGKPAYNCADMRPAENTKSTMKVEERSSGPADLCLSGGKLRGSGEESSLH
ncbi:uncharacterized protein LOC142388705 [Odontesthes bonariensis]|uniref:uncharacterized protein LOC142388705 n=1 Tax=Odontesthes bonariensis TaxID=219752 RepID=UPI003F5886AD